MFRSPPPAESKDGSPVRGAGIGQSPDKLTEAPESPMKPLVKLSRIEQFLKDKLDSGEIDPCLALLPIRFMKLSDKDWDFIQDLIQEQREE